MARTPNPFQEAAIQHEAFTSVAPVDNSNLITLTDSLESTGLQQVGAGKLKTAAFAETMHKVYGQIADLEIVPPLNEEQVAKVAGKVATYGAMREVVEPKPAPKQPRPSKVSRTDARKR